MQIITKSQANKLATAADLVALGQAANTVAAANVFDDYRSRKAANTIRRQDADLRLFAAYLTDVGHNKVTGEDLSTTPATWAGLTWGLVEGFTRWSLKRGYSVGSVNVRLSTLKSYAKLATKAGSIDPGDLALIRTVSGYGKSEAKRIDDQREATITPTRIGWKKAEATPVTRNQAEQLKADQPDTPVGRRDALLMALLIDHGLRVGEVAALRVGDFDLEDRTFTFYRPKVDMVQTHQLTPAAVAAVAAYLEQDAPTDKTDPLLRGSRKGGHLTAPGWRTQNINARVGDLGLRVGVSGLSPHDLRHHWATVAARNGTPIDRLQDAGGWSSPAMPMRYIEAAAIANHGVDLG